MGIFRRRGGGSKKGDDTTADVDVDVDPELQDQAQEVMKDNLELMRDVVMQIREDPEFASNIYANCPRLQHLLDQYPDLRPIFEDPKLVRVNFEQVYREAGGVLPEDEKKKKSCLVWFVNSPIFKVLKLLLFVKKLVACIAGGGFAFLSGCFLGCCFEDALEEMENPEDADADGDGDIDPAKEALNKAADHMEDPEVQEQMQALLEDPDNLQEAIENDNELRALRDSNPLCEELMSDPETMRVLTDPDNLRALGEAPQLIEADFIDPDGFMPTDVETGGFDGLGEGGYDTFDGGDMEFEADVDMDADVEVEQEFDNEGDIEADDDFEGEEEEEDEGWWEDAEMEEQEVENDGNDPNAAKGKAQAKSQAKNKAAQEAAAKNGNGRFGGIMASIGVAATDLVAAQIVGNVFGGDMLPGGDMMGGGAGGMDNLDSGVGDAANNAGEMVDDDIAGVAEETMDETQDKVEEKQSSQRGLEADIDENGKKTNTAAAVGGGTAAGGVIAGGAATRSSSRRNLSQVEEEEEEESQEGFEDEEGEEKKKGRFGFIRNLGSAIKTQAKEYVATNILGDDFGEKLVERMDESESEDSNENENGKSDDEEKKEDEKETNNEKKRGFFKRGKDKNKAQ